MEAKDLGTFGQIFPIEEQDMLELMQDKLKALGQEKLQIHQEKIKDKIVAQIKRPRAVSGITKATENNTRMFDPSFTVEEDIMDHLGNLIHAKGKIINPLDYVPFNEEWILIDGDDEEQRILAHNYKMVILVNGAPGMQENGQFYYFDQFGEISKKLSITKVPSIIRQKDKVIEIEEIALGKINN